MKKYHFTGVTSTEIKWIVEAFGKTGFLSVPFLLSVHDLGFLIDGPNLTLVSGYLT